MLRAILKLALVGGVVALGGVADEPALYAAAGGALLVLPFAVARSDRRRAIATEAGAGDAEIVPARVTLDVLPLPPPDGADDVEGLTVRAPMTREEAYEMHARYAPSFDQQAAIARYEAQQQQHEEAPVPDPASDPASFDQGRYAAALQYAEAFDAQLRGRRTMTYEVAPRRMARGSVTPQQYRVELRSDARPAFATSASDWDDRTIVGVPPARR